MAGIQPTKVSILKCSINDIDYVSNENGVVKSNFHVKEIRIFEDICKAYLTGQLVIETNQNAFEHLLGPTVPVQIIFESPRTDGGPTKIYNDFFRIYSYDSVPIGAGIDARIEHRISLIGQEYYNDRHNTVVQNFKEETGTSAAKKIHDQYVQTSRSGGLQILLPSTGLIGSTKHPNQVVNKKPFKAIHDILDRCVFAQYKSCAPIYYRDVDGFKIAPLQYALEKAPVVEKFKQILGAGNTLKDVLEGYNLVHQFRPITPPGENNTNFDIGAVMKTMSSFDLKTGNIDSVLSSLQGVLGLSFLNKVPDLKKRVQEMIAEAKKGNYGARNSFSIIDQDHQAKTIDKFGPAGYYAAQELFIGILSYSQKYWISVPLQTGLNVTCGKRIQVAYQIVDKDGKPKLQEKTLFVPRLVHEIKLTQGTKREPLVINGTTDMYGVYW